MMHSSLSSINGAKKKKWWPNQDDYDQITLIPSTTTKTSSTMKQRRSFEPQMDNRTELSRDNDIFMENVCHNHHPDYRSTSIIDGMEFDSSIIAKYCSSSSSMLLCKNIFNSNGQIRPSFHQRRTNSRLTMLPSPSSFIIFAIIVSLMMNGSVDGSLVHGQQHETKKGMWCLLLLSYFILFGNLYTR